jgi:hypothetical protein
MDKTEEGKSPCFRVVSPLGIGPSDASLFVVSGNNGFYRARIGAGATVGAELRINDILIIALADRFNRTRILTGTTGNALVRNTISHFVFTSPDFFNPGVKRLRLFTRQKRLP